MTNETKNVEEYAVEKIQTLEAEVKKLRNGMDDLSIELGCVASMVNAFSLQYDNPESCLSERECQKALYAIEHYIIRIAADMEAYVMRRNIEA